MILSKKPFLPQNCLKAMATNFHPECFACAYCNKIFANSPFYLEDGLPYCEEGESDEGPNFWKVEFEKWKIWLNKVLSRRLSSESKKFLTGPRHGIGQNFQQHESLPKPRENPRLRLTDTVRHWHDSDRFTDFTDWEELVTNMVLMHALVPCICIACGFALI